MDIARLSAMRAQMAAWRQDFHRHPELAFEERRTAAIVAELLRSFGLTVTTGVAGTGVVGTLSTGDGPAIGLRADMDALPIREASAHPHRSQRAGVMHACGHDGHTAMLLGAARHLAETRAFAGVVHFIFQPAEENEAGGKAMIEDGLFDRFPMDAVYGMHNWPGLEAGRFEVCAGPIMAAFDTFEITLNGDGAHAAMPHRGQDCLLAAAQIVTGLQAIVARHTDPQSAAVVSVTQVHGGDTWNVLPEEVVLRGCTRHFLPDDQDRIEAGVKRIAAGIATANGVRADVAYQRRYPATVNTAPETDKAVRSARAVAGVQGVNPAAAPCLASEDFAFMLQQRPGCYIRIGNGASGQSEMLHNPRYDFNDAILDKGAAYWVQLVENELPPPDAP